MGRIFCFAFFFFIQANGRSQELPELWYHTLTEQDGLSADDYNFYTFKDSKGYVWVSSTKGLNRFDGQQVINYNSNFEDSTALYGGNIQSPFFEDGEGNIWFSTYRAIHRYVREKDCFEHFFVRHKNGNKIVESYQVFYLERQKYLWLRAMDGIYKIDITRKLKCREIFDEPALLESKDFHTHVGIAENGTLAYLLTFDGKKKGLTCFPISNGQIQDSKSYYDGKNDGQVIHQILYESATSIWLTTDQGFLNWNMDEDTFTSFRVGDYSENEKVGYQYFTTLNDHAFLVSAYNKGLFLFDRKKKSFKPVRLNSINDPKVGNPLKVRNIYLDNDGVLWLTVFNDGLIYANLRKNKFAYLRSPILDSLSTLKLLKYDEEHVLVSADNNFFLMDREGALVKRKFQDLPRINHLALGQSEKEVWLATTKGLYLYHVQDDKVELVQAMDDRFYNYVYQLDNGAILVSTLHHGVLQITGDQEHFELRTILEPENEHTGYTAIYQDQKGQVYIGNNEASIVVFEYKNDDLLPLDELPIIGTLHGFYEKPGGANLFVATAYGLYQINTENFIWSHDTIINYEDLFHIFPFLDDQYWMANDKGFFLYDTKAGNIQEFDLADGMVSNNFKPQQQIQFADGEIWGIVEGGFLRVERKPLEFISTAPHIFVERIKVNGMEREIHYQQIQKQEASDIKAMEFLYHENTLSFDFFATDYADPKGATVYCKMEGIDEDWLQVPTGDKGFVRYVQLPEGACRFSIKAFNSDAQLGSESRRDIEIKIHPPFWKTWFFRLLAFLLVTSLIFLATTYKLNQVRKTEQLKTRIAENKMSALIAQMDPHFIFNCLQSINSFILKEDRRSASEYLGRFSKLIRMILENSRSSQHSLKEEIDFLTIYMDLESQRLSPSFQYVFKIDPAIDEYQMEIPTMILQPFIENAIWHGLAHQSVSGSIIIEIKLDEARGYLECTIIDDGVGRLKSMEIRDKIGKQHKSQAIDIVRERLRLFCPEDIGKSHVKIVDLYDENQIARGTKVEIFIRLMDV